MRTTSTLLLGTALFTMSASAQNSCSSALPITVGTYTVDAVNGPEIPVPLCGTNDVGALHTEWYAYTPDQDYSLTITTDLPQNAGGDTRFNVYRGNCGALDCAGGADDEGGNTLASATIQVSSGITYRIAFDDRWGSTGFDYQLSESDPVVTEFSFSPINIATSGSVYGAVDVTGDFLDDVVSVTSTNVNINKQLASGGFQVQNITTPQADFPATWSMAAGDLNGDGYNDLEYGNGSGVTFMISANGGTSYTEHSGSEYIFSQRTNMVDINNDGNLDGFVCHDTQANCYYINDGNGNLTFHQGGLGETCGNYGAVWIDYDGDHDIDMFVAKCGCDPVDILYRNNGDGTFTNVAPALALNDSHSSWSSAWADYDNDGDMDLFIGSSGSPTSKLMRNDNGNFTNVTAGSGFDTFTGTTIEWTCHDFNNDGWVDILGAGAMLMNNGDMTFTPNLDVPGNGPIGDLNNDGFLDIVNGSIVQMNSGNTNKHLTVNLIGTVSNKNGIGARVEVASPSFTQIRDIKSGDGFEFMSSLNAHFGLGTDATVNQVTVFWPSGIVDVVNDVTVNSNLEITEGSFSTGVVSAAKGEFSLFPNPAQDLLRVSSDSDVANQPVNIFDIAGQRVLTGTLRNDQLDISSLKSGVGMLRLQVGGRQLQQKFVKR
jgi:hypothetical protein